MELSGFVPALCLCFSVVSFHPSLNHGETEAQRGRHMAFDLVINEPDDLGFWKSGFRVRGSRDHKYTCLKRTFASWRLCVRLTPVTTKRKTHAKTLRRKDEPKALR